jgi:hypothetical protein
VVATRPPGPPDLTERATLALNPSLKQGGVWVVFPGERVFAAIGARLFWSWDGFSQWYEADLSDVVNGSTHITAVAIDPRDRDHWLIGTSFDGLYQTKDAGESWTELTTDRSRWPNYQGAGFFSEFTGLWFTPEGRVLSQVGPGDGYLEIDLDPLEITRLSPIAARGAGVPRYERLRNALGVSLYAPVHQTALWKRETRPPGDDEKRRSELAADKTGIYISASNASLDKIDGYLDLVDRMGYNSIVVDFKNDEGLITYPSDVELAQRIGAVVPLIDAAEIIRRAHERDIYVIARMVVFKDPKLYAYDGNRFAYWDARLNRPWGVYRTYTDPETEESRTVLVEKWADAYSEEVWQYNIDLASEVEALGVDEIQFDYIRFPSDGRTQDLRSRFAPEGATRVQALEAFLGTAREQIDVPISIDVFGFNGWARMTYLGQDLTRLHAHVDVISPMLYPSHFARPFLPSLPYLERAEIIYYEGTRRSRLMTEGTTLIRPYIQAFLIGGELQFERPTFERYLEVQVEGSEHAGADGYTLWNASGRYYMLPQ